MLFDTAILLTFFGEHFSFIEEHWDTPKKLFVIPKMPASKCLSLELIGISKEDYHLQGKPTMWCQNRYTLSPGKPVPLSFIYIEFFALKQLLVIKYSREESRSLGYDFIGKTLDPREVRDIYSQGQRAG